MAEHENPNEPAYIDELASLISGYIDEGTENIYFWDANHLSLENLQVVSNPKIISALQSTGKPVMAILENIEAQAANAGVQWFLQQPVGQRDAIIANVEAQLEAMMPNDPVGRARSVEPYKLIQQGFQVYYPDGRDTSPINEFVQNNPRVVELSQSMAEQLQGASEVCKPVFAQYAAQTFNEEDQQLMAELAVKFVEIATGGTKDEFDLTLIDNKINEKINEVLAEGTIVLNRYGFNHYPKQADLDENRLGKSFAFVEVPGSTGNGYKQRPQLWNDTPDYVVYLADDRIVKLDGPEALAEFLGAPTPTPIEIETIYDGMTPNQMVEVMAEKIPEQEALGMLMPEDVADECHASAQQQFPGVDLPSTSPFR